jgi:WD40 repeat protein/uncharacterized caspase-like protein
MRSLALVLALGALSFGQEATQAGRAPQLDAARNPEVWAVVIGVEEYEGPIPSRPGSRRDARAIVDWFRKDAGWSESHVLDLNDGPGSVDLHPDDPKGDIPQLQPTRSNLEWAFQTWVSTLAQPDDIVVVYFAGHMVSVPPAQTAPFGASGTDGLLPVDAKPNDLAGSAWYLDEAIHPIAYRGLNPIVVWLDTSSPAQEGKAQPATNVAPDEESAPARRVLDRLARWSKVTAWTAAMKQPGVTRKPDKLGPFVQALARSLGTAETSPPLAQCLRKLSLSDELVDAELLWAGGVPLHINLWVRGERRIVHPPVEVLTQRGHADQVFHSQFTHDGSLLVTGSADSTIRIWQSSDQTLLRVLTGHTNGVTALAISQDDRYIFSGDGQGYVQAFDLGLDGDPNKSRTIQPAPFQRHDGVVQLVPLSDGSHFATCDNANKATVWDASGPFLQAKVLPLEGVRRIAAVIDKEGPNPFAWAALTEDGKLHLIDAKGTEKSAFQTPLKRAKPEFALTLDGKAAIMASDEGSIVALDTANGQLSELFKTDGKAIKSMALSPRGMLAVSAGSTVWLAQAADLASPNARNPVQFKAQGEPINLSFSANGRWLVGLASGKGSVLAWSIKDPENPVPIQESAIGLSKAKSVVVKPDQDILVAGEEYGGVRFTQLPSGTRLARVPSARGRIDSLDASPDGGQLLEVTHEGVALIWDLQEGRGARALPGLWQSGSFIQRRDEDGALVDVVALVGRSGAQGFNGKLGLIPLKQTPRTLESLEFAKVPLQDNSPIKLDRVAASDDGRCLAAIEDKALGRPLLVFWNLKDAPITLAPRLKAPLETVSFSLDGTKLMVGAIDGSVAVYRIDQLKPVGEPTILEPALPGQGPHEILAVVADPANQDRIATADRAGVIRLHSLKSGQAMEVDNLGRTAHDLAFTRNGTVLAAAATDGAIHFWSIDGDQIRTISTARRNTHTEAVRALVSLPINQTKPIERTGPGDPEPAEQLFVSGSWDTTIRFWDAERAECTGTLTAIFAEPPPRDKKSSTIPLGVDWLAFAPDGRFVGSPNGVDQLRFILGQDILSPDQLLDPNLSPKLYDFDLARRLREGKRPGQFPDREPQRVLAISRPPSPVSHKPDMQLTLSIGDVDQSSIRLYHDNQPISVTPERFEVQPDGQLTTRVRLHSGFNEFYVMAQHPNPKKGFDLRSQPIQVSYDGPDLAGSLHVLALGVGEYLYAKSPLEFPDDDATELAKQLVSRAESGPNALIKGAGKSIVRAETEVSFKSVRESFDQLREATNDHPEDTVVIFLAGHTDVFNNRFYLLLNSFPFNMPAVAKDFEHALPYHEIEFGLSHLHALNRLVIVDACQAEAIFEDKGVEVVRAMDEDSVRAKVSYILAARRGEPAGESAALGHGLLTYTLLRALEAPNLKALQGNVADLLNGTADLNGDQVITSEELRAYIDATLPALAESYPALALRGAPANPKQLEDLKQSLTLRGSSPASIGGPFPIVELPPSPPARAD